VCDGLFKVCVRCVSSGVVECELVFEGVCGRVRGIEYAYVAECVCR